MTSTTKNEHRQIFWLDAVRLAAIFTVVCCHCTDPFNFYPGPPPANIGEIKFWGAAYGALLRPCVPLFAMLTGALLLPVRQAYGPFCRRRIGRVFWPFLLWSAAYALFPWALGLAGLPPETLLDFFPYSGEAAMRQDLGSALTRIAGIAVNFSPIAVHMWYIYLLIGLYLYMPVFSAWVEKASRREQRLFLALWAASTLLPYAREYGSHYIWGECAWNAYGMLYYFAGFNGYLLLGHYLRHTEWTTARTLGLSLPLLAAGYAVTFAGFRHVTAMPEASEEMCELFFTYNSLNVAAMSVATFMLLKKARTRREWLRRALANLTACGFGIYMIHYFFAGPSVLLTRSLGLPVGAQIPAAAMVAFATSWALVALARRALGKKARYVTG